MPSKVIGLEMDFEQLAVNQHRRKALDQQVSQE